MIIITPENDSQPHDDNSSTCPCHPHVHFDENGEMHLYHNPFDGREFTPWPEVIAANA